MGRTAIQWADYSLNPGVYGCRRVSPGCEHCYAERLAPRLDRMGLGRYAGTTEGGRWTGRVRVDYDRIGPAFDTLPKRRRARVFVTSMGDLFHEDVPFDFVDRVFAEMAKRPHLTFLVLTKRPHITAVYVDAWMSGRGRQWPRNVWPGTTVEDQRRANERLPHLLRVPAAVRFVSYEPALELVDWSRWMQRARRHGPDIPPGRRIDWLICGCESGPGARPMNPDWARQARDQCQAAGVAFFYKQAMVDGRLVETPDLDGRRWTEVP